MGGHEALHDLLAHLERISPLGPPELGWPEWTDALQVREQVAERFVAAHGCEVCASREKLQENCPNSGRK